MDGQRLRELRKVKKLKQTDLAIYLNSAISTISMYENNNNEPDNATLIRLADLFKVSVDYLLGRTDTPQLILNNTAILNGEYLALTEKECDFLKECLLMHRKLQAKYLNE